MQASQRYPFLLKSVFEENRFQNIIDSNMFSAYIADELPVPQIADPRTCQVAGGKIVRYPGYVRSRLINQTFNYAGYIKRTENRSFRVYLPLLFQELNHFLRVLEDIVFTLDIAIPQEIYIEQKKGIDNFLFAYKSRTRYGAEWINDIWKHQKNYLEHIDMFMETLKARGQVFDFSDHSLYTAIVAHCKNCVTAVGTEEYPKDADFGLVANCCLKAAHENESKTLWSGDRHILIILKCLYRASELSEEFPQIYLRSNYHPQRFTQSFP